VTPAKEPPLSPLEIVTNEYRALYQAMMAAMAYWPDTVPIETKAKLNVALDRGAKRFR
jgi:hypothetical protein